MPTIGLITRGEEVGSVIEIKREAAAKEIHEERGTHINFPEGDCPEKITLWLD